MIDRLLLPALKAIGWFGLLYAAFLVGPDVEGRFMPVLRGAEIEFAVPQGADVLVGGTLRKARNCRYIDPWRARVSSTGRMLQVLTPESDKSNWPKTDRIQFAPVIVVGAGREKFELWAEHECHPLWHTMTLIAEVQAQ